MAQKIITVILALIIVGGFAWYINANYLEQSTSNGFFSNNQKGSPNKESLSGAPAPSSPLLIYATFDRSWMIWQTDLEGHSKKLFTDQDEQAKILKLSNLIPSSGKVLAVTAPDRDSRSGDLVMIDLKKAVLEPLEENFFLPDYWSVSDDGQKIASTSFSNVEENYGYTLYYQTRQGDINKKIAQNESAILFPTWDPSGAKVAFGQTLGTTAQLIIVDVSSGEIKTLQSFEENLDWISWGQDGRIIVSLRKIGEDSQGAIKTIDPESENSTKLIDFSGGRANFVNLSKNSQYLGYLIAQDQEEENPLGQIYIEDIKQNKKIPIQKGVQVLGWLE